jgi:hypothetical protein
VSSRTQNGLRPRGLPACRGRKNPLNISEAGARRSPSAPCRGEDLIICREAASDRDSTAILCAMASSHARGCLKKNGRHHKKLGDRGSQEPQHFRGEHRTLRADPNSLLGSRSHRDAAMAVCSLTIRRWSGDSGLHQVSTPDSQSSGAVDVRACRFEEKKRGWPAACRASQELSQGTGREASRPRFLLRSARMENVIEAGPLADTVTRAAYSSTG